ncbi:hypothetical protein IPH25_03715 [bacterium]|nr:MAG: hypothetical protein IPG37_00710 [bacterium]QQR61560.1 MAG: hypothetical protein IPH25_03715 [bacterium]QQR62906.1 MAG: hypothetical protein IPH67_00240 [bacterium]
MGKKLLVIVLIGPVVIPITFQAYNRRVVEDALNLAVSITSDSCQSEAWFREISKLMIGKGFDLQKMEDLSLDQYLRFCLTHRKTEMVNMLNSGFRKLEGFEDSKNEIKVAVEKGIEERITKERSDECNVEKFTNIKSEVLKEAKAGAADYQQKNSFIVWFWSWGTYFGSAYYSGVLNAYRRDHGQATALKDSQKAKV